jgi:hypothetical protein
VLTKALLLAVPKAICGLNGIGNHLAIVVAVQIHPLLPGQLGELDQTAEAKLGMEEVAPGKDQFKS